jgi:putative addiction module component (TIGR02574 family)
MNSRVRSVLDSALALSESERAEVARELLATLSPEWEEVTEDELVDELDRRWGEALRDPVAKIPWSEVRRRGSNLQGPPEGQLRSRAEFILEEPGLWFAFLFAAGFLATSAAIDLLSLELPPGWRYIFPFFQAVVPWLGLRDWARRILRAPSPLRLPGKATEQEVAPLD